MFFEFAAAQPPNRIVASRFRRPIELADGVAPLGGRTEAADIPLWIQVQSGGTSGPHFAAKVGSPQPPLELKLQGLLGLSRPDPGFPTQRPSIVRRYVIIQSNSSRAYAPKPPPLNVALPPLDTIDCRAGALT